MSRERPPDLRRDRGSANALRQYSVITYVNHQRTLASSRASGRQVRSRAATNRCQPRAERFGATTRPRCLLQQVLISVDQQSRPMLGSRHSRWLQPRHVLKREGNHLALLAPDFDAGIVPDDASGRRDCRGVVGKIILTPPRDMIIVLQQIEPIEGQQGSLLRVSRDCLAVFSLVAFGLSREGRATRAVGWVSPSAAVATGIDSGACWTAMDAILLN